jgi:hypothetical protein
MSGSRNDGVNLAKKDGCNVIVLNDADTFPQIGPLLESIQAAANDNKVHLPYNQYRFLYEDDTKKFLSGIPLEECDSHILDEDACSGVNVFSLSAWDSIGGGDEKFKGWGREDNAMNYVHTIVHGTPYVRHKGVAFSLYHQIQPGAKDPNHENLLNNTALFELYKTKKSKEDVLNLVKSKDSLEDLIR